MRTDAETENLIKAIDSMERQFFVVSPDLEIIAASAFSMKSGGVELIGKKCFEVFCKKNVPCEECNLREAFQKGKPAPGARAGAAGGGRKLPCDYTYPIYSEDKIEALVCTDIGLQRSDDPPGGLQLANAFLKNLIHSSPDAVIAADRKGKILLFNDAAVKLLGYSSGEVHTDLNITDFYPEGKAQDVMARLRSDHYGGKGKLRAYHAIILDKHGRKISIRLDASIIYGGEKELATIGYFRDLSDANCSNSEVQEVKLKPDPLPDAHSLESIATSMARRLKLYNQHFGDTATRIGLIDKQQLIKARDCQKQLQEKTKIDVPLERVLVQLEYITEEQRTAVIAMQALGEDGKEREEGTALSEKARRLAKELELYSQRFGDLAMKLGFISEDQLKKSLKMQRQAQEKTKIDIPLGRVLEQLEYITEEQRAAVLAVQALTEETEPGAEETEPVTDEAGHDADEAESGAAETEPVTDEAGHDADEAEPGAAETEPVTDEAGHDADEAEPGAAETEPVTDEAGHDADEAESGAAETEPVTDEAGHDADEAESGDEQIQGDEQEPGEAEGQNKVRDYFSVDISEDKLTARLMAKTRDRENLDFDDVRGLIETEGVKYGMVAEEAIREFIEAGAEEPEPLRIAQGFPPGEGKDPEIVYHFETDPLKAGELKEDGTIDWKKRGEIPQVDEGNLLAEIIPGTYGAVGMDVFGNEIPALPIAKISLSAGKGVKKSGDGNSFIAGAKGIPNLSENGTLTVSPVLQISGDLGIETGHVEFDGHIEVAGAVQSGYQVRGGSLRAQSIDNAEIYISGDVVVVGGIFESKIKCQGNVKAVHVHKSEIDAGGDLAVDKEITDSKVELYGACKMEYGTIISSEIAARGGMAVQNVGTAMSKPSHLDVGVDHKLRREISGLKKLLSKAERKKKEIRPQIETLKTQSDQINGELGDVAQKQDQYVAQIRQLQDKFKGRENIDESVKAEFEKAVAGLEARRSKIDAMVEELMQKDSDIETTMAKLEEQETESTEEQAELEERIEILRQKGETEKGKPVVKVSGNLFHGTKITGPKSKITINDDCRHVNIFETDKTDDGQFARWHMKIGPLR